MSDIAPCQCLVACLPRLRVVTCVVKVYKLAVLQRTAGVEQLSNCLENPCQAVQSWSVHPEVVKQSLSKICEFDDTSAYTGTQWA